jgi:hypothetical protein
MRSNNNSKSLLAKTGLTAAVFLLASERFAQPQVVNLTAGPATATLPDGSGCRVGLSAAQCGWLDGTSLRDSASRQRLVSVVITIPTGQDLQINLTNNLTFTGAGTNTLPTSLTIIGQLGGGLGSSATTRARTTPTPAGNLADRRHAGQRGARRRRASPQGPRVQSFATEVAGPIGTTASLCWALHARTLRP